MEWDKERNKGVAPGTLKCSSDYSAYWVCNKCGYVWQTTVRNRTNGSNCPCCAGRKVVAGINDLESQYPEIAEQWVSADDGKKPSEVSPGSHVNVLWECGEGHRWYAQVKTRTRGYGCPYCSGRKVLSGYNDLETLHPELMDEWNWDKNKDVRPFEVAPKSNKKYWWVCRKCGYEWQASPASRTRTDRNKKSGCPCCNHKVVVPGKNDATTYNPRVAEEWSEELNGGRLLSEYLPGSNEYGWWVCSTCGESWYAQIQSRVKNQKGCPYCATKKPTVGVNDLATVRPDLVKEWHRTRNKNLKPEDVTEFSSKSVWWECSICGNEWRTRVADRTYGKGCPRCATHRKKNTDMEVMISERYTKEFGI